MMGQNVPKRLPVTGTILLDSQQPVLQDNRTSSSVDGTQQQVFVLSDNPAYKTFAQHSQQPLQKDYRDYSNLDISHQVAVTLSGNPKHGTALGAAASAK